MANKIARGDIPSQQQTQNLLLPEEVSEVILRGTAERSAIRKHARSIPMTTNTRRLTEAEVTGANVFWVGEGQRKSTDAPNAQQKSWTLSAAELAVIVPIDENVQEDAAVDLFELYQPAIETAIARKLDAATLFGLDVPTAWGSSASIKSQATTAGHVFAEDADPTDVDLIDLMMGTGSDPADGALQAVEDDGYDPDQILSYLRFRARLRNLKDADNRPFLGDLASSVSIDNILGVPAEFYKGTNAGSDGFWVPSDAHMIMGDFDQALIGTRQDVRYKVFDQGVITDGAGNVVYSLMEYDMVALRVTARFAFKVLTPDTADGEQLADGDKYPFAIVQENQA
jgi:hypothetical protein